MMRNNPKVSIIVPVYNVEKYLKECIESVLNQSVADYELILVDDGSVDESPRICDEYAQKDNRICVIHQKNQGVGFARNAGLNDASGEFVAFLDSDDWLDHSFLQKCLETIYSTNCDMCISGIHFYNKVIVNTRKAPEQSLTISGCMTPIQAKEWIENCLISSSCSKLFRRSIIGNTRFDTSLNFGEDLRFCLEILKKNISVAVLDWAGYYYRMTPNSLTSSSINEKKCKSIVKTYQFLYNHAKENGFWDSKEYMEFLDKRWSQDYFGVAYDILDSNIRLKEKIHTLRLLMMDRTMCDRINALDNVPIPDATSIFLLYMNLYKIRVITILQEKIISVKNLIKRINFIK